MPHRNIPLKTRSLLRVWKTDIEARALQSAQLELERKQATDSLRKGLEKRPERDELIERMQISYCAFYQLELLQFVLMKYTFLQEIFCPILRLPLRCRASRGSWRDICVRIVWSRRFSSGLSRRS